MKRIQKLFGFGLGVVLVVGCTSIQNNSIFEAMSGSDDVSSNPYVTAYIEYPGPHRRWAGPTSFSLKLDAKGDKKIELMISPDFLQKFKSNDGNELTTSGRKPASEQAKRDEAKPEKNQKAEPMSAEAARAQLAFLADAIKTQHASFQGCLYPVRVRLIRANGEVLEKFGCRGQNGWPRMTSDLVANLLSRAPRT